MATVTNATPTTGLLNLEKELICFICTEVLYQPLTLIDCLHTFCGSCLKEWFSHQHRKASHSHTPNATPYTCPTCRATVKDAQHNAMINTLLDMFLVANPEKRRSAEEIAEMSQIYRPGDEILPKVENRRRERRRREEEDLARRERRLLEEARERSLREVAVSVSTTSGRDRLSASNNQERSHSRDHDERRERRIQEREERRQRRERGEASEDVARRDLETTQDLAAPTLSPPLSSPRHPYAVEARSRARTVAHQASLRSLVSASDSGTGTGDSLDEAVLMQEILSEGLLDGIDVDNLTEAEQDELSEVIAERYRQLHPRRAQGSGAAQSAETQPESVAAILQQLQLEEADRQPPHLPARDVGSNVETSVRSFSAAERMTTQRQHSDTSQTLTLPTQPRAHHRRASDQSGRPDSSGQRYTIQAGAPRHSATRSATDLSDQPESTSMAGVRRLSSEQRSSTEPQRSPKVSEIWKQRGVNPTVMTSSQFISAMPTSEKKNVAAPSTANSEAPPPKEEAPLEIGNASSTAQTQFEEPAFSCYRCSKAGIQYDVYKHCTSCDVNLCSQCYRAGRGCNHWFGFGHAAMARFEASHPRRSSRLMEWPHKLVGRQYTKPPSDSIQQTASSGDGSKPILTTSDPASRLQEGQFCDRCGNFANACCWTCEYCNDGEWGYCNDCVNTHHCCTHALLPIAHKSLAPASSSNPPASSKPTNSSLNLTPSNLHANNTQASPAHSAPSSATSTADPTSGPQPDYINLSITTHCDLCSDPIPPTSTRYHCPTHLTPNPTQPSCTGDYDICTSCYHNLVKTGRIKRDDGPAGWRKCPQGHRMIMTAFEHDDDAGGQRRVVTHELVGGVKMTEGDIAAWQAGLEGDGDGTSGVSATWGGGQGREKAWTWRDPADQGGAEANKAAAMRRRGTRAGILSATDNGLAKGKTRFPPEGGFGRSCVAGWSYYPEEGEEGKGELMFPKNAVVREVLDVNEDWCEGTFQGEVGFVFRVYLRNIE